MSIALTHQMPPITGKVSNPFIDHLHSLRTGYHPIDPFSEYRIAELQIQLAKAQSEIEKLELHLEYTEVKLQLAVESGGIIDALKLHQMGF